MTWLHVQAHLQNLCIFFLVQMFKPPVSYGLSKLAAESIFSISK